MIPERRDDGQLVSTPERKGIDAAILDRIAPASRHRRKHGCGRLLFERDWPGEAAASFKLARASGQFWASSERCADG